MKKLLFFILIIICPNISFGQGVGINLGGAPPTTTLDVGGNVRIRSLPDSSALYDVKADAAGNLFRDSIETNTNNCGIGFLAIYDTSGTKYLFSIENNPNGARTWFNASKFCGDKGLRLCTASEWYVVCQRGIIPSMGSNDEWVDDFIHEDNILVIGGSTCDDTGVEHESTLVSFRCCCDE